ncbi:MAG: D-glycero-beta-D-manno-heptose 1,7-bisphosphate 7-phosphatase [Chloroflexota bacterium]
MRPAIFLDRDGTINVEVHYLKHPDELRLIDGAADAIVQLRAAGFAIIVVTNQSGIARGYFSIDTLDAIHEKLRAELAAHGATLDGIYACHHHPADGCDCRKPQSSLYLQAAREHGLDLSRSVMIGDKDTDLLAAKNLSMPSILVRTGFGIEQLETIAQWANYQPAYIADDLLDAARWLMADGR